jgi:hypothetical protein
MKTTLRTLALVASFHWFGLGGQAATLHVAVPPTGDDANPGTEAQPFATIQRGVDAAAEGDTVIVQPGTYLEGVLFRGKNLVLRSTDPLDTNVVSQTVIDGDGARIAVQFDGTESASCRLEGLTVTRGSTIGSDALGAGISGGTPNRRTRATLRHNRIIDNQETGVACCDGLVEGNLIAGNTSWKSAGGLAWCDGVIRANWIQDNRTFQREAAGGLAWCQGAIEGNTISRNGSAGEGSSAGGLAFCHGIVSSNFITANAASGSAGGGLDRCDGLIDGNQITLNSSMYGGALAQCHGPIQGNTIAENSPAGLYRCDAAVRNNLILANQGHGLSECDGAIANNTVCLNTGFGLFECDGPILNCIVWGNHDHGPEQLRASSTPAYSCVQHWPGGGAGNFALAPHFLDAAKGDYRLQSWSPCIDAGDPAADSSGEPEPSRQRIDVGAFGNTDQAATRSPDSDGDGLPDAWELQWFGELAPVPSGDPDGDGILNETEYRYGWDPRTAAVTRVLNRTQGKWYQTIQTALGESVKDDRIVVQPGLFRENIHFQGKDVGLESSAPDDREIVARTIIEGHASGAVVAFDGTEDDEYCLLQGLTLRHGGIDGYSPQAWGICGGTPDRHTRALIINNVITGNAAEYGAGMAYCDGIVRDNTITNNHAWSGGGLAFCNGVIERNTIAHNRATLGGGLANCHASVVRNVIADNLGHGGGGGLLGCSGAIQENVIRGNWTEQDESAGGGLKGCQARIAYNLITGNRSRCDGGGGLAGCGGDIVGNLIAGNATDGTGGGLMDCSGLIQNNTVADNLARAPGGGLAYCGGVIQNCIVWGNTAESGTQLLECALPLYSCIQDWAAGGEGNLAADPCFASPAAGNYRLGSASLCIDAGEPGGFNLPERDLSGSHRIQYGGRRFAVDMGAYEFAIARCDLTSDPKQAALTWSSQVERVYYVSWSSDLRTWSPPVRVVSAGNAATSWTDSASPATTPARFYRIHESIR